MEKTKQQIAEELIAKNRSGSYEDWLQNTMAAFDEYVDSLKPKTGAGCL